MIELDDSQLAAVLASIGERLVTEQRPTSAQRSSTALSRRGRRPVRIATITVGAAAAAVAVVLVVAPLRRTFADWLGIGSTQITIDPSAISAAGSLPSIAAGLVAVDRAAAEARLGTPLPDLRSSVLGAPAGWAIMPEGGVLVVWPDTTTLWIHDADLDAGELVDKLVPAGEAVRPVDDLGDEALVITGDHILRTPRRDVAATTTVLWTTGSQEFRLESDRDATALIAVARALSAG